MEPRNEKQRQRQQDHHRGWFVWLVSSSQHGELCQFVRRRRRQLTLATDVAALEAAFRRPCQAGSCRPGSVQLGFVRICSDVSSSSSRLHRRRRRRMQQQQQQPFDRSRQLAYLPAAAVLFCPALAGSSCRAGRRSRHRRAGVVRACAFKEESSCSAHTPA